MNLYTDKILYVGIQEPNGFFMPVQPYNEYTHGNRNIALSIYTSGYKLFDILKDELGYIKLKDNRFQFTYLFESDVIRTSMRLLGRIAEAVIVRNCNSNDNINKKWFKIARKGKKLSAISNNYIAIGTGLLSTKRDYPTKYNPGDPQRDIKWINKHNVENELIMIGKSSTDGTVAGIQVKISLDGKRYCFQDLLLHRYEVPLVYFGVGEYNDFSSIAEELYRKKSSIAIGEDFIDGYYLDTDTYEEIKDYVNIIIKIVNKELSPEELISQNFIKDDYILESSIVSSILEPYSTESVRFY